MDEKRISLTSFLGFDEPENAKVKFNMNPGDPEFPAWDLLRDDDPRWFEMSAWRTKHADNNLDKAKYVFLFAQYYPYGPNYFVFGGLYEVRMREPEVLDGIGYDLVPCDRYSEYSKRLIIRLREPIGRNLYLRWYEKLETDPKLMPEVYELAPRTKLGAFEGYNQVCLSYPDLKAIVTNEEPSWKLALSSIKAVYAIADKSTGKLYIGSASGNNEGLWQRWASYADPQGLTGGNKEFKELKADLGEEYITANFQYSILEIFDMRTPTEDVLHRESFWKTALDTRAPHGLNHN